MSRLIKKVIPTLPAPWEQLSYRQVIDRPGGLLVHGGRASQVHLFADNDSRCYLKRYLYQKIHWRDCWRRSPGHRESENLEKIRGLDLGCQPIEILAYGEERRWRILKNAFLLSREVAGGQRLSLFLQEQSRPERELVVAAVINALAKIIRSGLALGDLFFRNFVVTPQNAGLFLLDLRFCRPSRRRAREKSYPQAWSNILLLFSKAEQQQAKRVLAPFLPYSMDELNQRSQTLMAREKKYLHREQAYAAKLALLNAGEKND